MNVSVHECEQSGEVEGGGADGDGGRAGEGIVIFYIIEKLLFGMCPLEPKKI